MKSLLVCLFAAVLLSQAVESLRCYVCPQGRENCWSTLTCEPDQDRCLTILLNDPRNTGASYARYCGNQDICDRPELRKEISCCATDLCNS